MSKLDHFLINRTFSDLWLNFAELVGERVFSGHYSITVKSESLDFGPSPFRLFDHWLSLDGLPDVAKEVFHTHQQKGQPNYILKEKLKFLKKSVQAWTANLKEHATVLVDILKSKFLQLEREAEIRQLEADKWEQWQLLKIQIFKEQMNVTRDLKQKSRNKCAAEGDKNSTYFHAIRGRKNKNSLKGLLIYGIWIEDPPKIKKEIASYFEEHFKEPDIDRPRFDSLNLKRLTKEKNNFLQQPFTDDEIKQTVFLCRGTKAPGPDGFNFNFIKTHCEETKGDVCAAVKHFHKIGRFVKGSDPYFLMLIPKVKDLLLILDFRPISLIGCFYKIVLKLLVERLKGVIGDLVSETQTAYIKGRQITDGILIANELVSWAKREQRPLLLLKVDFVKAFDSISWAFLKSVLYQMNFGTTWRKWIMRCLQSARLSILVNGSPTHEISMQRGLR